MAMIEMDAMTDEAFAMLIRLRRSMSPEHMSEVVTNRFREALVRQASESFAEEGTTDGARWAPLSDWRVDDRNGEEHPILEDTGSLRSEVGAYRGKMRILSGANEGLSYWFPDAPEMSGKYWGLTAGQLVNPLGATPLAAVPRPLLAGSDRQGRDTVRTLVDYFMSEGYLVEVE